MPIIIKKLRPLIEMLTLLAVAALIGSCCSDCPTGPSDPKPYKGWLYATDYWHGWIYKIDIESDSAVDSIKHEGSELWSVGAIDVSQDGQYFAINYTSNAQKKTRIFDAQTLELITEIDRGMWPIFVASRNLLIGLTDDGIGLYSLPGFQLIKEDLVGFLNDPVLLEDEDLLYVVGALKPEASDSQFFMVYNYLTQEVEDTLIISDSLGNWFHLRDFDIDDSRNRLYFTGYSDAVPSSINCYDLIERNFLFRIPIFSVNGDIRLTPDRDEFYFVDPGYPSSYDSPGTIFIYDSENGNYLQGISLFGYTYDEYFSLPLYAYDIIFTPDGKKAYIGSGNVFRVDGTIMVIDTRRQQITKLIWPELGHYIGSFAIGPKQ